jgi:hypothetical protein
MAVFDYVAPYTLVDNYRCSEKLTASVIRVATRCNKPEDIQIHTLCRENLISHQHNLVFGLV